MLRLVEIIEMFGRQFRWEVVKIPSYELSGFMIGRIQIVDIIIPIEHSLSAILQCFEKSVFYFVQDIETDKNITFVWHIVGDKFLTGLPVQHTFISFIFFFEYLPEIIINVSENIP